MVSKLSGKNSVVVGMPRHGKTYFVMKELQKHKGGVLYINPKPVGGKSPFTVSDGRHKRSQMINFIKAGGKMELRINGVDPASADGLEYIIDGLLTAGFKESSPIILAIDEMHYYKDAKKLSEAVRKLAMTGVSLGISSVFMSQRFANINYDAVAICENLYFFKLGAMEGSYLRSKKLPYDDIQSLIDSKGRYSYCIWDTDKGLHGPYKE